jgi:hypothetical protein
VQHERQPLRRGERLEHHEQRHAHRVGEHHLLFGIERALDGDDRVGKVRVQQVLAPRGARAQHVEADARHDGGQPAGEVLDRVGIGAAQPQPRLLHRVVGLGDRPEHAVGDRAQVRPVLLELLGQELLVVHRHVSSFRRVMDLTPPRRST